MASIVGSYMDTWLSSRTRYWYRYNEHMRDFLLLLLGMCTKPCKLRLPSLSTTTRHVSKSFAKGIIRCSLDEVLLSGTVSSHDGVEEQQGEVGLFLGLRESSEGNELLLLPLEELGVHVRAATSMGNPTKTLVHLRLVGSDVTWAESVDSDTLVGPLRRQNALVREKR